jgi:hypothetical protein
MINTQIVGDENETLIISEKVKVIKLRSIF